MRASYGVHVVGATVFCYKIFIAQLLCDAVSFNSNRKVMPAIESSRRPEAGLVLAARQFLSPLRILKLMHPATLLHDIAMAVGGYSC